MAVRNRCFALAAIALPFLFLAMSGLARAATITVDTTMDDTNAGHCTLREAINSANGASSGTGNCTAAMSTATNTINFNLSGTITLGSTLPAITNSSPGNLTIDGSGQAITLDGASKYQIFSVNSGATLNLQFLTLENGSVKGASGPLPGDGDGGAIFNSGTLTVTSSTFSDDQATGGASTTPLKAGDGDGGAIFNGGTLTATNSTFSGNQATGGPGAPGQRGGDGDGGAIFNQGTLTVTNSTFSDNQATGGGSGSFGEGGAIFIFSSAVLTVTNSTFSGDSADVGGGIENDGGSATLKGTILADSGGNCAGSGASPVTDGGYNISSDDTCMFSKTGSANNGDGVDPLLDGLAGNGGPTQTFALQTSPVASPAIDAIPIADCTDQATPPNQLTTDQRGFPRPDAGEDVCDIGAYESQETFTGLPAKASCHGASVSALSNRYGTLDAAAAALGFPSIKTLQTAIKQFCAG